jgi:hypothetical protein
MPPSPPVTRIFMPRLPAQVSILSPRPRPRKPRRPVIQSGGSGTQPCIPAYARTIDPCCGQMNRGVI